MAVFVFSFSSRADLGGWVTEVTLYWTLPIPGSILIKAVQGHWLCVTGKWCPMCVVTLKAFFSWIKFGQSTGVGLLPSPPCPGQLGLEFGKYVSGWVHINSVHPLLKFLVLLELLLKEQSYLCRGWGELERKRRSISAALSTYAELLYGGW